ncbi:protoporphyrin IX magnesium-chelatase [Rhizobium sp. RU20A]|uniref:VWA domain-containing protein n=1 Tax=Rhizobium sp. RU20A TaxID=1907412 RepID=UPI00095623BE|nr:VWA domain-containing protein [Rhizobium sp. RU20A]SIR42728.1 protoporphyrin IX magnesium-chelatase [Rhizobium sp. RU20A]
MDDVGASERFQEAIEASGAERWHDALLAAAVLSVGRGALGGLWLTARAGGVRDAFVDHLIAGFGNAVSTRRLPPGAGSDALHGRLDLAATARTGRRVEEEGLLSAVTAGLMIVPMAERLEPGTAATLAEAMEPRRFVVLALDEAAEADEAPPCVLTDRLALHVSLDGIPLSATRAALPAGLTMTGKQRDWHAVGLPNRLLEQMLSLAFAAGHGSARAHLHLFAVARILAMLAGRRQVRPEDAVGALRLCLGIRLLSAEPPSQTPSKSDPEASQPPHKQPPGPSSGEPTPEEAEAAHTPPPPAPPDALSRLEAAVSAGAIDGLSLLVSERAARQAKQAGKAGAEMRKARRGRPYATGTTPPFTDQRPDLLATLRAAAPFQRLRRCAIAASLAGGEGGQATPQIRKEDFRYHRRRHAAPSTAIFVVDASGSTALDRLGETKGAIEQLLARCYVRRDEVALIAFRAEGADLLLPPTRSLVAAKRRLAALPGGGPTPLAAGLKTGLELALSVRRRGHTPIVVVLTDGAGNVALGGEADRALAARQADDIARRYRAEGLKTICVDIARRPRPAVAALAEELGADLHVLRAAAASGLSGLVETAMTGGRP